MDNRETETFQKIPFLGDIPVLGKFFQSISRTKTNTELIVIVTPEIVTPSPAGSIAVPNYPEKFMEPNSNTPMHTPDGKPDGARPAYAPSTMPVEELIHSQQPEKPLDGGNSSYTQSNASSSAAAQPK